MHGFYYSLFIIHCLLPYQAQECFEEFEVNLEGIAVGAEVFVDLQWFEVWAQRAVVLTGDRDVLAVEESRIALSGPGQGLGYIIALILGAGGRFSSRKFGSFVFSSYICNRYKLTIN